MFMRISKAPEERKQEIMEAAMQLFEEKGYEETSMADIAKKVQVVQGLCYRYFPSKQDLFNTSIDSYIEDCCKPFVKILCDTAITNKEKMNLLANAMTNPQEGKYKDFFHKSGNGTFHDILSVRMCKYLVPYLTAELEILNETEELKTEDPETTAEFIIYGQIALWQKPVDQMKLKLEKYRKLLNQLFGLK